MSASLESLQQAYDNPEGPEDDYVFRSGWFRGLAAAALADLRDREERIAALERELEQYRIFEQYQSQRLTALARHAPDAVDSAQRRDAA